MVGGRMANQLDKTKYKNKIADVETEAQLEDLAYLAAGERSSSPYQTSSSCQYSLHST
jgi:hypothetical protein